MHIYYAKKNHLTYPPCVTYKTINIVKFQHQTNPENPYADLIYDFSSKQPTDFLRGELLRSHLLLIRNVNNTQNFERPTAEIANFAHTELSSTNISVYNKTKIFPKALPSRTNLTYSSEHSKFSSSYQGT